MKKPALRISAEHLIRDLLKTKKVYEKYFKSLEQPDNQALTAYTNIIKTAAELMRKLTPQAEGQSPDEMKRIAEEILESEYGIKRN